MQSVELSLSSYSVSDVLALSKEDLKDLLGVQQGIRLFARIAQHRAQVEQAARTIRSPQRRDGSAASRPSSTGGRFSQSSACSRYGQCSQRDCVHPSVAVCSVAECGACVCVWHEAKSLLTGHVYCPACAADTLEGKVKAAYASATTRADEATTQIIHTTAEWTASGKDAIGASAWMSEEPSTFTSFSHSQQSSSYHSAGLVEEEKQQPRFAAASSPVHAKAAAGESRLPFVSQWLRGEGVEEIGGQDVEDGQHYREVSWNERAQTQCSIQ